MKEMNNDYPDISETTRMVLAEKVKRIKEDSKNDNYFESNNMFIKTFVWAVMEYFGNVYCIYLHRNPWEQFLSHADRNWKFGQDWFLKSHWKMNIQRVEPELTYYENMIWNWYEVRARFYHWKDKFVKTYDFDFQRIEDLEEYYRLFEHFGIEYKKVDKLPEVPKTDHNEPDPVKESSANTLGFIRQNQDKKSVEWAFMSDEQIIKENIRRGKVERQ